MLFSKNKERSNRKPAPEGQLKLEIEIKLKKTNHKYNEGSTVAKVKLEENFTLTTDAPLKAIKNEIESIVADAYEKVQKQVDASPHLSDGYHADKAKEEGTELPELEGDNE